MWIVIGKFVLVTHDAPDRCFSNLAPDPRLSVARSGSHSFRIQTPNYERKHVLHLMTHRIHIFQNSYAPEKSQTQTFLVVSGKFSLLAKDDRIYCIDIYASAHFINLLTLSQPMINIRPGKQMVQPPAACAMQTVEDLVIGCGLFPRWICSQLQVAHAPKAVTDNDAGPHQKQIPSAFKCKQKNQTNKKDFQFRESLGKTYGKPLLIEMRVAE